MNGDKKRRQLSLATRRELVASVATRYASSTRADKKRILDEFATVTGYHRKHAIRALRAVQSSDERAAPARAARTRLYGEEVVTALTVLWEAADRICGKRLKQAIPIFITAMERHGHLDLPPETRNQLLSMSAATIDRLLRPIRDIARQGRRRTSVNTTLRKSIAVRTFEDWNDPPPGYFEMDMVAHCGRSVAGNHVHSLVLTDIASGWTEAAAMVVREQTLVTLTVEEIRRKLPFSMLGLDVDNDSAFINETVLAYCGERGIEITRSRAYKKNDQAWIEQKNGAVVRKLVGYGRLEGVAAANALSKLHDVARLYVNFFQPSFKLRSKTRQGARVLKWHDFPVTPFSRLLASDRVSAEEKKRLQEIFDALDPVQLLAKIRLAQQRITELDVGRGEGNASERKDQDLDAFLCSLRTLWRDGEVRATHRKRFQGPRRWRTRPDPFETVWPLVQEWLSNEPTATAKDLFEHLQARMPGMFSPGQLRTLQRRVKHWRTEIARRLVWGASGDADDGIPAITKSEEELLK
jgi:hypothetical protein